MSPHRIFGRTSPRPIRTTLRRLGCGAAAGLAATACATTLAAQAGAQMKAHAANGSGRQSGPVVLHITPTVSAQYSFLTLDDSADLTFNQLLGINDIGKIAGYFGSGASATHPNKGYTISAYSGMTFTAENYPGSAQTQVTGLNDMGKTVGFYVDKAGNNFGFWSKNGQFASVSAPGAAGSTKTTQLLGVNNEGMSVGFYNDAKGNAHAFTYNTKSGAFSKLKISGAVTSMATGINDNGDVTGIFTTAKKVTESFLLRGGVLEILAIHGASATQAFGVNDFGQVVGQYTVGKATHGFLEENARFVTIDDPAAPGATTINGINNLGDLVGFYTDAAGNTDGFVAQPQYQRS